LLYSVNESRGREAAKLDENVNNSSS